MREPRSLRPELLALLAFGAGGSVAFLAMVKDEGGSIPMSAVLLAIAMPGVLVVPLLFRQPASQAGALFAVTVVLITWVVFWIPLFGIGFAWVPAALLAVGLSIARLWHSFK